MAVVSPLTTEGILGLDFLKDQRAVINLESEELLLQAQGVTLPLRQSTQSPTSLGQIKVKVRRNISVPAYSELEVMAHLEDPVHPGLTWTLENSLKKPVGVVSARALVCPISEEVPVRLINTTSEPALIYAGKEVAILEYTAAESVCQVEFRPAESSNQEVTARKHAILWDLVNGSGTELTAEQKEMFHQLLVSYADVIADSSSDLGRTNELCHSINTGSTPPIRQSVRRLSPQRRSEVQQVLNDMLKNGVVERSTSPWASPIVLVRKKDGSTRFCVDYQKVNQITHKDAYPLSRIDATLDAMAGSKWFSTLDLLSGYWQVKVEKDDRSKTAFCTMEGRACFNSGLCHSAFATHQLLSND